MALYINHSIFYGILVAEPQVITCKGKDGDNEMVKLVVMISEPRFYGRGKFNTFVEVVTFDQPASYSKKHLTKGDRVVVEGKLKQSHWADKLGEGRNQLYLAASQISKVQGNCLDDDAGGAVAADGAEEADVKPENNSADVTLREARRKIDPQMGPDGAKPF